MLSHSILSYKGPLSFSTIDGLLSEFKIASQEHKISFRTYKKMISIVIEALENITRYCDHFTCNGNDQNGFCPRCDINHDQRVIELITSNPVKKEHVPSLREKIDNVNSQDGEELNKLYKSTITNGQFSSRGGAGLGFIEMAKTTGHKLEYSFEELGGEYSLYTFRVCLDM